MTFEIVGTGTTHYGQADWRGDSYVTTKWAALLGLPIYPLQTYRVVDSGYDQTPGFFYSSRSYKVIEQLPLNKKQVAITYVSIFSYAVFAALMFLYGIDRLKGVEYGNLIFVAAIAAPVLLVRAWNAHRQNVARKASHR